jgi:hypothetical protein
MDILYYIDLMSQFVVVGPRTEQNNQQTHQATVILLDCLIQPVL